MIFPSEQPFLRVQPLCHCVIRPLLDGQRGRPITTNGRPWKSCGSWSVRPVSSRAAPLAQCCHSFELQPSWPPKLTATLATVGEHPSQSCTLWSLLPVSFAAIDFTQSPDRSVDPCLPRFAPAS